MRKDIFKKNKKNNLRDTVIQGYPLFVNIWEALGGIMDISKCTELGRSGHPSRTK